MDGPKAHNIEDGPSGCDYLASPEELQAIDAAIAEIDRGELATEAEIAAVFNKFRQD